MSEPRIEAGKIYWICVDNASFQVEAIRPTTLSGWWLCKSVSMGDQIVVPATSLQVDRDASGETSEP
jgi:hypothetical protein